MIIPKILTLNELDILRWYTANFYKTHRDGMTAHWYLSLYKKEPNYQVLSQICAWMIMSVTSRSCIL